MEPEATLGGYAGGNAILDRLSEPERNELLPNLEVYVAEEASVLYSRDSPITAVHFPISAIYSVVVQLPRGSVYEVDLIGRKGAVGAELCIGAQTAARTVLCQAEGRAVRVDRDQFMDAIARSAQFFSAVSESLRRQWFDSQQTVACNLVHSGLSRAARWILMTQDEVGNDHFSLRREFLAIMLGITPERTREPLAILTKLGCIDFKDEWVTVHSRSALREYACDCYALQQITPFINVDGLA